VREQLALLPGYLTAHLELTLVALLLGCLVSVPAGILATRRRSLETPLLGLSSVIQTIPSLALLAIMVPLLALASDLVEPVLGLSLRSIGYPPAIVALTLYSTLPILRNTVTGIQGVDPAVIEAARGAGMTDRQQLRQVELPLAMPVIVAGLRTATVWVVGTATLSTPVGATSLGNFIFSGLQTRNFDAVLVGCLAAALLALVLDQLIRLLESGLRRQRRAAVATAVAAFAVLYGYTALSLAGGLAERERPIRVGSKTFTEQYILSEILVDTVEQASGLPAEAVQSLGSTVLFDALRSGEIDVYVDYSGTIWATIMKRPGLPGDRAEVLASVEAFLAETHGIVLASALGFENTYALAMRGGQARQLGIETISALVPHAPGFEIGGDYEFFARPEWAALERAYGLRFRTRRNMDASLMYQAVASAEVDVISAFSTDGRITALDLRALVDDRGVIPPYDAIVLVGPGLVERAPAAVDALRALSGRIDANAMRTMNLSVDRDGLAPAQVARRFLSESP
jgi:osmoprotectant transport system permease protein